MGFFLLVSTGEIVTILCLNVSRTSEYFLLFPLKALLDLSALSSLFLFISLCLGDRHEVNVIYGDKTLSGVCTRGICRADIHQLILSTKVLCGCGQQKLVPIETAITGC